jgi:hypothetical protein
MCSARLFTKLLAAVAVSVVLANGVSAYTIVFRDGHRVEAPAVFTVTPTTLTYEAAPGINRTLQLILIDVAATERVNHEAPGSFLKHAEQQVTSTASRAGRAQRILTNLDLEPFRQRRLDSEQNYEKRRIELGLPSLAETRRRQALEEEATLGLARSRAAAEAGDETYWRSRARTLRYEIVSVDAEINYLRAQFAPAGQIPFIGSTLITSGAAFGSLRGPSRMLPSGAGRMGTQGPTNGAQGLTNLGAVALRPQRPSNGFVFRGGVRSFPIIPFGYSANSYDSSFRLNELLQRRAGLEALWRELENEARLAKVPQVWLAPY